jgi:hypothetical protein
MLSSGQVILLGMLLGGFFAVACLRASTPQEGGKFVLRNLFFFPDRIERLRRTRWQWSSMVLLMLVLRLQHMLPLTLEAMAALQFIAFLAAPTRAAGLPGTRRRGDGAAVANH